MSTDSIFGEVIYSYTRTQAIEDGVLVDVSETAAELGFRLPVAVTAAVWTRCVDWESEEAGQDEKGCTDFPDRAARFDQPDSESTACLSVRRNSPRQPLVISSG